MPKYERPNLESIRNRKSKSVHQQLIDLIKERMEQKHIKPYVLADEADIPRSYMYRFLEGCHSPTLDVVMKIFRILDLEVEFRERNGVKK